MKFESKDDNKPIFEAKGLETIRRDQCALTQKVLKNSLIALFTRGIEAVKAYLFRQWSLILSRCLPVSDFILTGRVRSRYRGDSVGPVQAVLARRLAESDPGRVVRHKQRVAYVIVASPGVKFKLRDGVLSPMELLEQWDAYVLVRSSIDCYTFGFLGILTLYTSTTEHCLLHHKARESFSRSLLEPCATQSGCCIVVCVLSQAPSTDSFLASDNCRQQRDSP